MPKNSGGKRSKIILWPLSAASAVFFSYPAFAQQFVVGDAANKLEQADDNNGLTDIVVTAQKRVENIQDTPVTVTALSGQDIAALHTPTIAGLQGQVVGLQITPFSNNPDSATLSIRGVGSFEPFPFEGMTVGVVSDGLPIFFAKGALLDLFDVERLEVLKGPQGTLFGANTTGGVVNIISKQPTAEFGGQGEVTVGNYNRLDATAAINIPLSTDWAIRIAASHQGHTGYVRNVINNGRLGDQDHDAVRAIIQYKPSTNFKASLKLEGVHVNDTIASVNASYAGELFYTGITPICTANAQCKAPDELIAGARSPTSLRMKMYTATATLNWDKTALGDLVSITGYRQIRGSSFTSGRPDSPFDQPVFTYLPYYSWQLSQELRTNAVLSDRFSVTAGLYGIVDHYKLTAHNPLRLGVPRRMQLGIGDQDNWSGSVFGQGYYQLTDKLQFLAGMRFTHERTSMLTSLTTGIVSDTIPFDTDGLAATAYPGLPPGTTIIAVVAPPRATKSWNELGGKVGANYHFTDDAMAYALFARGFKSGGFSGRIGIASDIGPFKPEHLNSLEIGAKTEWFDRHLRINVAGFYNTYRDLQVAGSYYVEVNGNLVRGTTILNAPKAKIKGFEVETQAKLGRGFSIDGSLAYLHAVYEDFPFALGLGSDGLPLTPLQLAGRDLQAAPKWQYTLGATYDFDIFHGHAALRTKYSYTAERYLGNVTDTPGSLLVPTKLLDASVNWTSPNTGWGISIWGRNLTDQHYFNYMSDTPGSVQNGSYGDPRTFGVTLRYSL